jgi:hypothetical protein
MNKSKVDLTANYGPGGDNYGRDKKVAKIEPLRGAAELYTESIGGGEWDAFLSGADEMRERVIKIIGLELTSLPFDDYTLGVHDAANKLIEQIKTIK